MKNYRLLKYFSIKYYQRGAAVLFSTLVVLSIVLIIILGLTLLTLTSQRIVKNSVLSAQAYYAAESGAEDSLYRIIKGKQYQATNSVSVGSSSADINITDIGNEKIITLNGQQANRFRNLEIRLAISNVSVSFFYGVQVGEGGLIMSNNSLVDGSVYSNGSIQGGNGARINGDVFVASIPAEPNQTSELVNNDFIFGQTSPIIDAAQSFTPSTSDRLTKISLYLKKAGSPGNKTVRILTDNGNKPSKTLVASGAYGTLNTSQISQTTYGWTTVTLNTPPILTAGTKYWIVIDSSADNNNYFFWGQDIGNSYSGGNGQSSANWNASSPVWTSAGGDFAFRVSLGDIINTLNNVDIGGHAHSNTIADCAIDGDAYYQTISGSTIAGTSYPDSPDPPMENMPLSDANIDDWKLAAQAGGVIDDDLTLSGTTNFLGPKKINGNFTIINGADLTITGTLYVTGNIVISNNAIVRLGEGYGTLSGVVIADGAITVSNNAVFYTNGAGTYLMFLSTKTGSAINVANNANAVIFYTSRGTANISNNAILKEVTAYQLNLSNGAQVIYESGLASALFSSGAGAGWQINDWQEVP